MKTTYKQNLIAVALLCTMASSTAFAAEAPKTKTPIPPGIVAPDTIESRLGTLKLFDGFPDDATVQKLYDNLDFQRPVKAYLLAIPAVNQAAMRKAITMNSIRISRCS